MKTFLIDPDKPSSELLSLIGKQLRTGKTAIVPTDTVYGIGVAVYDGSAPKAIYEIKGRDSAKAIACLISKTEALEVYGKNVPEYAKELAKEFWPGALTLIVEASERIPNAYKADDGSIALRVPAHPLTLALLNCIDVPLATSSANLQGKAPALDIKSLDPAIVSKVGVVIDAGIAPGGIASTIVSCLGDQPRIIREGAIPSPRILLD